MWCIPPKQSAAFVYHMEDVLDVYQRPPDPKRPVVCMDETFKQLIGETREPLPPAPGRVERFDHVYVRNGVASLFLAFEPLTGWRHVAVTDHRRRLEWASFIKTLVDDRYKDANKIVLVMDQLNTHSAASLYEAFPPAEAKRLAGKLEIHHTPKHGSPPRPPGRVPFGDRIDGLLAIDGGQRRVARDRAARDRRGLPGDAQAAGGGERDRDAHGR